MNPETIDNEYAKLQEEVKETGQALLGFSQVLQAATAAGDINAKRWLADLKSVAVRIQQEEQQMQSLMQAVHDFTISHLHDPSTGYGQAETSYSQEQPMYSAQPGYVMQQPTGGSSALGRFMGGGFGHAMVMGAGFGLGDDLLRRIL